MAHVDFERGGSVLDFYAQTGLVRSGQRLETLLLVVVLDDWLGGQVEGLLQIDLVLENAQDGLGAVTGSLLLDVIVVFLVEYTIGDVFDDYGCNGYAVEVHVLGLGQVELEQFRAAEKSTSNGGEH